VIALLDASVLYPAPLRDLLMNLALLDVFQARWSNQIHDEWTRNVLKNRPDLQPSQIERTRTLMNLHIRDCLVSNFEHLIPALQLPDLDDRHVLATAIHSQSKLIVTANLKHFPIRSLEVFDLRATAPDDFVLQLFRTNQSGVLAALSEQRANLKKPTISAAKLIETLEQQGLKRSVERLKEHLDLI
jgi:predicted nucleic acid-binding protein